MNTNSVLQIDHLKKYFGSVRAVEDVSLSVKRGEIFGFLGPNGAGKTTTISMILGLTHPTAGEIEVFNQRVTPGHNRVLRRVGTMVGAPALMLPFTARENLQCMAYLRPNLPVQRIDEILKLVDLAGAADRRTGKFSTGMKQRLGLGLALINKPELLILDEPTNGMDPAGMHEVRTLLRTLADEQGITIFLSSHLLHEMEILCDRVAVVQHGSIIAQGAVSDLLHKNEIVRIQTSDREGTVKALRLLPGVHDIQVRSNSLVEVQGVPSEQILAHLVAQGVTPREVMTTHADLESVFLELTERRAGQSRSAAELEQQ
jgi:ABC-type multidrug transport system ATPase subunit